MWLRCYSVASAVPKPSQGWCWCNGRPGAQEEACRGWAVRSRSRLTPQSMLAIYLCYFNRCFIIIIFCFAKMNIVTCDFCNLGGFWRWRFPWARDRGKVRSRRVPPAPQSNISLWFWLIFPNIHQDVHDIETLSERSIEELQKHLVGTNVRCYPRS